MTNFAINKENPNYVKGDAEDLNFESRRSHKRSILNFFEELKVSGVDTETVWSQIKDVVVKTICSIQPILRHNSNSIQADDPFNQSCFEILGFDIMIDEDLTPFLIEVNHAPSFGTSSNVDLKVKGNLIRDTLNILGINSQAKGNLLRIQARNLKEISLKGKKSLLADREFRDRCL